MWLKAVKDERCSYTRMKGSERLVNTYTVSSTAAAAADRRHSLTVSPSHSLSRNINKKLSYR